MGENVQCPVCTLFLHAGMNLSDHLETHPKEQVIKALVQMMISGGGSTVVSSALAGSLDSGGESKAERGKTPVLTLVSDTDSETISNITSTGNQTSSATSCDKLANNKSSNLAAAFSGIPPVNTSLATAPTTAPKTPAENIGNPKDTTVKEVCRGEPDSGSSIDFLKVVASTSDFQQSSTAQFDGYASNRYHQTHQKQLVASQLDPKRQHQHQEPHRQQSQHKHIDGQNITIGNVQQRIPLPPPAPPSVSMQKVSQLSTKQQHPLQLPTLFANNVATHRHAQMHSIQQPPQNQRQHQQQTHNQQQQNLKIFYSTALPPPPPPLQMFPFNASPQLQHQKPPPAYGTAISQIRSQHNQNKNKYANEVKSHHQQHHQLQQRPAILPPSLPLPQTTNSTVSLQSHHEQQQPLSVMPGSNPKVAFAAKQTELLPPPPSNSATPSTLQQLHQQPQESQPHFSNNMKSIATPNRAAIDGIDNRAGPTTPTLTFPSPAVTSCSATVQTPAIVAIASAGGIRQVSSPYNSLLVAATSSPSSSSVLRYAESPVAHYLERDNGDFIVQETPKHIVECVEKDNGEFSVIERIYQSPLSVLHMHEENDNEKEVGDIDEDGGDDKDVKNIAIINEKVKTNGDVATGIESTSSTSEQLGKSNKSQHTMDAACERPTSNRSSHARDGEICVNQRAAAVGGKGQTKAYGSEKSLAVSPSRNSNYNNTNGDRSTPLSSVSLNSGTTDTNFSPVSISNLSSNFNSDVNVLSSSSTSANQSFNSTATSRKRSSKNTITVLSDVQLNLNEYLDLVGNIIASSKISSKSSTLSGATPIPFLKVEKEEPPDDYEMQPDQEHIEHIGKSGGREYLEPQLNELQAATVIEPPTIANKNETELVENICSSNKSRINDSDNEKNAANVILEASNTNIAAAKPSTTAACSSHVTSVIRMATTSQQQQQQQIQQHVEEQEKELAHETTAVLEEQTADSGCSATVTAPPTPETYIIIQDFSQQHIVQFKEEQHAHKEEQKRQQQRQRQQQQLQQQQQQKQSIVAQNITDLSQQQSQAPPSLSLPTQKKGPKKLIIKPKVTKTDANANLNHNNKIHNINNHNNRNNNRDVKNIKATIKTKISSDETLSERPTTSSKAQMGMQEKSHQRQYPMHDTLTHKFIKSEPSTAHYEGNVISAGVNSSNLGHSILKNHLNSNVDNSEPMVECKIEQPCLIDPQSTYLQSLKEEAKENSNSSDNAAAKDDARVLLDFANSKKHDSPHMSMANFLSATSIFSNTSNAMNEPITTTTTNNNDINNVEPHVALRCEDDFIANEDVQEIVISSSYSQSQSASDVPSIATNSTTNSHVRDLIVGQQHQSQQQQHHLNHSFSDYPFSFLYGNAGAGVSSAQQPDAKGGIFSAIYQQAAQDATTAATLASGSSTVQTDESTSSTQQQQPHTSHFGGMNGGSGGAETANTASQWYHHSVATANADFDSALAVDCNATADGGDVGKYLDLDTCKREVLIGVPGAPSSTSSSFAAATESSLAGGCTTDALNIRTDEKMPAKGEISGQESNCDIENSWSQPMYGEISARFFKTTFPGIFQHENGWNHEEYFTVQDLSASAATVGNAVGSNRSVKSFDFRLPLEATTSAAANGTGNGNSNFQLFAQQTDVLPSTSSSNKKRRKREIQGDNANAVGRSEKAAITRLQPTATITSQQLLFHQQIQTNEQLQHPPLNATTSAAFMSSAPLTAGSAVVPTASSLMSDQRRQRKKVYQCTHCTAEFPKLKDRNSHMIVEHNYVRQNRRLICVQRQGTGASSSNTTSETGGNVVVVNMADGYNSTLIRSDSMEFLDDSKQDIVKIEVDNAYHPTTTLDATAAVGPSEVGEGIDAKPELLENKESVVLVPTGGSTVNGAVEGCKEVGTDTVDTKPTFQPLAVTTPATKLAALYRMLVSYNISTLKDSHNLSEMEQKLIEQSIFFCYVCRSNFTSVKLYDAHLSEHPAECFTCGKTFQRWKNFSLHLKRHLGWKEFGCNVCDKKFVVRSALVEHMRMHTGHMPLKCKVCGKYFKRYSNLTQHRKRHGKQVIRKKEYVCHCGEVLPSKARFLWHKETHDAKPKCCPYCCDRFVHANSLRRHIRLAHSDKFDYAEPMECPMCKQIFAKTSIKAHMATHSMDTQHDCAICNKSFSTKWNLKIHSWVHANRTAKPFKCEHCPKAFVREVDFKNHMNAHKQIKPYTCEYCGCKFIRKYNYMRHRREHHDNKKFTCDLCKKTFHRHYYLIEHRRIHTGERPFQCTICGKSSTTKTNHNKHLKIHHSRDPFTVEA